MPTLEGVLRGIYLQGVAYARTASSLYFCIADPLTLELTDRWHGQYLSRLGPITAACPLRNELQRSMIGLQRIVRLVIANMGFSCKQKASHNFLC